MAFNEYIFEGKWYKKLFQGSLKTGSGSHWYEWEEWVFLQDHNDKDKCIKINLDTGKVIKTNSRGLQNDFPELNVT